MSDDRDFAPMESFDETQLPAPVPGNQVMIQTQAGGSVARKMANPRDLRRVMGEIKVLAAMAGEDWYYRWPVKDKSGKTTWVEGASIKCASAVARIFGNCDVACTLRESATHYIFEALFVDLETGFHLTRPFQQRKAQNIGKKMDAARQEDIIFQIGVSKATRNVVTNALETFTDFAKEEAKKSLIADIGKSLEGSRNRVLSMIAERQIDLLRVELIYAKKSNEWLAPDIAKIVAELRAIDDGMASKDDTYPPTPEEQAKAEAALKATEEKPNETTTAEKPKDWAQEITAKIEQLNSCTSSEALSVFIKDKAEFMQGVSGNAPSDQQSRWTEAFTGRMRFLSDQANKSEESKIAEATAGADVADKQENALPLGDTHKQPGKGKK